MKKIICIISIFALVLSSVTVSFGAIALTTAEKYMLSAIDKNKAAITTVAKEIWGFKELGMQEFKSSKLLMDMLEKEGFKLQRGLVGKDLANECDVDMPTAFIATFEGKGKGATIGLLVEYDALPNGHACGHNLISSSCYAAAIGIKEYLKNNPGTLKVFGTPAEEVLVVKQYIADGGFFEGVDVAYSPHGGNEWTTVLNAKAMTTTTPGVGLVYTGKASHASSAPWVGRSALDAVMLASLGLEFMREHMFETDRIHYAIINGGAAANVVHEKAAVDVWIRSDDSLQLLDLLKRAENIFEGAALMTGTTVEYAWDTICYSAIPVPKLATQAAEAGASLGIKETFNMTPPSLGSTDAGNAAFCMPMAFVEFPVDKKPVAGHTDEFAAAAITDYAIDQSILAGKVMALSAVRLLSNPNDLKAITEQFKENKGE